MPKRERIRVLKERIRDGGAANYYDDPRYDGDTISDDDAATLLTVSDQFDLHDYSDNRHEKLLRHLVRVAEKVGGLTDALDDREAAEALVRWINLEYDNPRTKCDYRLAIRAMGKHALRRGTHGEPPESIEWMSSNTPRNYDPQPSRADMLNWQDDVLPLINEGTDPARNKALFAVQFEGGFRPHCELYEMRVGDVKDTDYGVEIEVDGKTGERMSYVTFQRYFKRAAKRIGLDNPVTPKNFRKSNATWLAKLGKNESFIEDRQGRKRGSDAISHYVAMYGEDRAREYAAMHGQDVETENPQDYTPMTCPRCRQQTPRDKDICMWCNQALDHDTYKDLAKTESTVTDMALHLFQQDEEFLEDVLTRKAVTQMLLDDDDFFEQAVDIAGDLDVEVPSAVE